jgi:aldehyde:ferredoxin oxidoreductase
LTGGWGDANCGGTLGPAIKKCGYDGIFFKGIAKSPVYLFVDKVQKTMLVHVKEEIKLLPIKRKHLRVKIILLNN